MSVYREQGRDLTEAEIEEMKARPAPPPAPAAPTIRPRSPLDWIEAVVVAMSRGLLAPDERLMNRASGRHGSLVATKDVVRFVVDRPDGRRKVVDLDAQLGYLTAAEVADAYAEAYRSASWLEGVGW